jgi:anti-sigma B factor antagonist
MRASIQENNDWVVFHLEGALTLEACDQLRQKVSQLLLTPRKAIVFDMGKVSFIDSAGLEMLIWIRDHCQLNVVQFRLAALTEPCLEILEMTRLTHEFHCGGALDEAVNSLA